MRRLRLTFHPGGYGRHRDPDQAAHPHSRQLAALDQAPNRADRDAELTGYFFEGPQHGGDAAYCREGINPLFQETS